MPIKMDGSLLSDMQDTDVGKVLEVQVGLSVDMRDRKIHRTSVKRVHGNVQSKTWTYLEQDGPSLGKCVAAGATKALGLGALRLAIGFLEENRIP